MSAFFVPFFVVLAGAVGFYLRLMELLNVFEPLTGLPMRGATITYVLIVFSVLVLSLVLIFAVRAAIRHNPPNGFENAFGTDPLSYPFICSIIGLIWLGATIHFFLEANVPMALRSTEVYFSILSALSAISVTFFAIEMYQDSRRKMIFALSMVPTLFMCFWLIMMYRQNASNPILLSYVYQCLAIISSALGFYFTSGFLYNKPAPGKAIFFYFAAVYFCIITLADDHAMSIRIIISAIIVLNLMYASMLIRNLRRKYS